MKIQIKFYEVLIMLLFLNTAYAHKGGGGGGAFVCRTGDTIHSAVFQDIWEAEEQGIPIMKASESAWTERDLSYELIGKLKKVSPKFYEEVEAALDEVMKIKNTGAIKLIPLGDSKHTKEPFDCKEGTSDYLSVAQYIGDDLTYSEKIWSQFTRLIEKSATHVHEAIYKVLRDDYRNDDSEKTRDIVGLIASSEDQSSELVKVVPLSQFNPHSSKSFKQKLEELTLVFNRGEQVHPRELNNIGDKCYAFHKTGDRESDFDILDVVNERNIGIEKKQKKKKVKKRVFGTLKFDFSSMQSFTGKYYNPIVGRYNPGVDLESRQRYYTNNVRYFLNQNDLVERVEMFNSDYIGTIYLMSKDQFGNIILAMRDWRNYRSDGRKCSEYYKIFLGFSKPGCKKYKEFNVLEQDKYFNPSALLFCPSIK